MSLCQKRAIVSPKPQFLAGGSGSWLQFPQPGLGTSTSCACPDAAYHMRDRTLVPGDRGDRRHLPQTAGSRQHSTFWGISRGPFDRASHRAGRICGLRAGPSLTTPLWKSLPPRLPCGRRCQESARKPPAFRGSAWADDAAAVRGRATDVGLVQVESTDPSGKGHADPGGFVVPSNSSGGAVVAGLSVRCGRRGRAGLVSGV
jgi:hypothetical protein